MVVYNKHIEKPGRAGKTGSGPRDRQMAVQTAMSHNVGNEALITTLTEQVVQLRNELAKRPSQGYTDEEFNTEVVKAVEASIAKERDANSRYILELENKLKAAGDTPETMNKLAALEAEVNNLKSVIDGKNETIEVLKSRPVNVVAGASIEAPTVSDSDRPQMDSAFIDPSESGEDYKSNINVESVEDTQKVDTSNKVNKLRNLLGGGIG